MAFYHPGARKAGLKGFDPKFKFGIGVTNRNFDTATIPDLIKGELVSLDSVTGLIRKALSTDISVEIVFTPVLNSNADNSFSAHNSGKIATYAGDGIVETWLFDPAVTVAAGQELTVATVLIDGVSRSVYSNAAVGDHVCGILEADGNDGSIRVKHIFNSYKKPV